MSSLAGEFQRYVVGVMERFARQNGRLFAPETMSRFAMQLWRLIEEHGLPPPLRDDESGLPGELDKREVKELTARAMEGIDAEEEFEDAAKQIVKACFYPEFRVCRDSYRERSSKGVCKRQMLEKARGRVSGSHCVDCPYWTSLAAGEHEELLASAWCGDAAEFAGHRGVFLPEDFRALRRWVRNAARRSAG